MFDVGDRVKYVGSTFYFDRYGVEVASGTVYSVDHDPVDEPVPMYAVCLDLYDDAADYTYFFAEELERLNEEEDAKAQPHVEGLATT